MRSPLGILSRNGVLVVDVVTLFAVGQPLSGTPSPASGESPAASTALDEVRGEPLDPGTAVRRLAARGLTVTAMARELNISTRTVERNLARLRERFQVASTAELASELAKRAF